MDPRYHPLRHARGIQGNIPASRTKKLRVHEEPEPDDQHVPRVLALRQKRLGHGHRHELLRGLQCLRCELLRREQHRRGRQAQYVTDWAASCSGCASTPTSKAIWMRPGRTSSRCLPALRERSLRTGVPGGRHGPLAGRPEHSWSTTAAWAPATAPTTVPTRCGASTSCSISDYETESLKLMRNPDVTRSAAAA